MDAKKPSIRLVIEMGSTRRWTAVEIAPGLFLGALSQGLQQGALARELLKKSFVHMLRGRFGLAWRLVSAALDSGAEAFYPHPNGEASTHADSGQQPDHVVHH
jgi:hypothetical protein